MFIVLGIGKLGQLADKCNFRPHFPIFILGWINILRTEWFDMGLITETVVMKWHPRNKKWYESKGYIFTKWKDEFEVNVKDLSSGSGATVDVECDNCNKVLKNIEVCKYNNYLKDGKYYCHDCSMKLFGSEKMRLTKLKKGKSFAEYLIDLYGEDALKKYWSDKNTISPYDISYGSTEHVYINCLNKLYHEAYLIHCNEFAKGQRCPYCNSNKVHKLDSLGTLYPEVLEIWSENNKYSPFELSPMTWQEVEWKCKNGIHSNYSRQVNVSNMCNFRCPSCVEENDCSILQDKVKSYLEIFGGLLHENNCTLKPKNIIKHKSMKKQGYLRYDNELILSNGVHLFCEVHGKQHYEMNGWCIQQAKIYNTTSEYEFKYQKLKDEFKKQYVLNNKFHYLEIPYWTDDKKETWKKLIKNKVKEIENKNE